jgi:para-nitrobenzyl esterase
MYQVLGLRTWPERDGRIVPTDPWEAYANGAVKDIDILHGCNKDEINTFLAALGEENFMMWAAQRTAEMKAKLTDEEKALVESYCNDQAEGYEKYSRLIDQWLWIAPVFRMSENQTMAGGKSYTYFLTAESAVPLMKSGHATDDPLVFNHPELTALTGRAYDATYTKTIRKMWVQFAKTGNPSLSPDISPDGKAKEWPVYDLGNKQLMILDEFDIHPEKESQRKIVDWDRTYFLTKYFTI